MSKAEEYSFNIPSELFQQLTKEQQVLWRKEIENTFNNGYHQAEKELIDKAIGWIGEIYNYHEIMRYSDSCEPPLEELTEWFKNYMKEGGKDE